MPTLPATSDLGRRVLVTLLVVAALFAARTVPIPGLDPDALAELPTGALAFSVVVLGPMTWISSFLFVELGALTRERWRTLRVGGPAERARLEKPTRWVWAVLCCTQGLAIAVNLERMQTAYGGDVVLSPGWSFRLLVLVTLAAGSSLYWIGARVIDRFGFGNGFAILVGLMLAESTLPAMEVGALFGELHRSALAPTVALLAAVAYGTWRLPTLWTRDGAVPLLSAGFAPLGLASLPFTLLPLLGVYLSGGALTALSLGLAALGTVVYAVLFHLPWNVAPVVGCTVDEAESALARSLPFAALVVMGATWVSYSAALGPGVLDVVALSVLGAHAWDLSVEWQARRALGDVEVAWQLHRVYAVPPALRALEHAGIPACVRGLRFRQLVQFFGPHVPIELLVPRGRGVDARRVLEAGGVGVVAAA